VTLRTTTGHQRSIPDALVIGRDGVVRGAALDRLGVTLLTVRFAENRQGRPRIQELTIAHPEGVTGSLLRRLPLERIEQQHSTRPRSVGWYGDSADVIAQLANSPRRSERFYHDVAAAYLSQVKNGVRRPALAISTTTGAPPATVRGWIRRARELGYLPPARRGAAG
jgi:hypothetical protein